MKHLPPRWTGHRAAQAVWVFILVLEVVLLAVSLATGPNVLNLATPAVTIVVAGVLLRQSLRTRRHYAQQR